MTFPHEQLTAKSQETRSTAQEPELRPLDVNAAVASFLVPGLGQLFQKRWLAFFGHFFLFLIGAGAVYTVPYFLPLSALLAAFSALDAAVWVKDVRNPMRGSMQTLMIVMILAGCVALLVSPVQSAREAARRMQCVPKQLALAFHNYHDTYDSLPPVYTVDENGRPLHSWRVLLLPFVEGHTIYGEIRLNEPWDSKHNRQFHDIEVPYGRCPSGPAADFAYKKFPKLKKGNCYFSVIVGPETPFPGAEATTFDDCTDGTSNTILFAERMTPICWMDPNNEITFNIACEGVNRNLLGIGSAHPGGANCSFVDGSCPFLSENTDLKPFLTKSAGDEADREVFRR